MAAARPERPCMECGVKTTAKAGLCRLCKRNTREQAEAQENEDASRLGAGRWVNVKGIQRWVPADRIA